MQGVGPIRRGTVIAVLAATGLVGRADAQAPDAAALFKIHCATCHTNSDTRAPSIASLRQGNPQAILDALTTGAMREQGSELRDEERRAISEYVTGRAIAAPVPRSVSGHCVAASPTVDLSNRPQWNGWGAGATNMRFQSTDRAGLTVEDAPKLTLKWVFGFPNATAARALPTVGSGRLFVGSESGIVYSLDAKTGCIIWTFAAKTGVRTAISLQSRPGGGSAAYFGDIAANVYAVDALNGELLWMRTVEEHPIARITGAPTLYEDRLYVPVSSLEEGQGRNDAYECCTFRGSVVAVNAITGRVVWKTYTIAEQPKPIGKNARGAARWGPSGAAIWSAPTIDAKRRLVYAATGNMYTEPQQPTSDAVLSFDMDTGKIAWSAQLTPKDIFVVGCNSIVAANCPKDLGADVDFGSSPMLATLPNGRDVIVIGQKSGMAWALDPQNRGSILWQYRAGRGGALGGIEWGSALDGALAYFAVSDVLDEQLEPNPGADSGSLHAVHLETGARAWRAPAPPLKCGPPSRYCNAGLSAAITVIPGAAFVGSNDGALRVYSTKAGAVVWEFDTNRDFATVNGVPGKGGTINGPGPTVADGMVYVNSGYGGSSGRPGNVLLAFGIDESR